MDDFAALVAEALAHLYDHPRLQTHELGRLLVPDPSGGPRGRALQRVLTDAIGELRPTDQAASAHAWRTYRYLFLRYVQALTPQEVARELGVSERQARRTYREAVDALASLLWDRRAGPSGSPADRSVVEREVAKLASAGHGHTTDLAEVVDGLRSILEPLAREQGCELALAVPAGLPPLGLDRAVARQILLNLTVAALACGPGRLRVEASPAGRAVRVELALATARPGAVEPDPARLAIARRLALAERGAVSSAVAAGQLRLSATLPSPGRPTVMVVDDNPDVALVLRRHLESAGLEVVALDRGELAVERARELRPVAIALDVMMAGQDGWETLQQLKNHPQTHQIPVLICSVLREPELARFLGAAALLPKPLTRSDLLAALARLGVAVRPSVALPGD